MSMNPGHTTLPETSTTSAPFDAGAGAVTRSIRPSVMTTSCTPSVPFAGSITRPPLSTSVFLASIGLRAPARLAGPSPLVSLGALMPVPSPCCPRGG